MRRLRVGLLIVLFAIALFAVAELALNRAELLGLSLVKLLQVATVAAMLAALRVPQLEAWVIPLALLAVSALSVTAAASNIIRQDLVTTPLLLILLSVGTATLFPWGLGPQLATVAIAGLALLANVYLVSGSLAAAAGYPAITVAAVLGASVGIAYEVERYRRAAAEQRRERARAQEALRQSDALLRTVVTGAPIIVFASDRDGAVTLSEGRGLALLGLKPGEVVGRSVGEVYGHLMTGAIERALVGEAVTSLVHAAGLAFETWCSPLRDQDGTVVGVVGVATDITELERASRLKSEFVATMSHELRTPLNIVMGYTDLLLEGAFGDLTVEQLAIVQRMAQSTAELQGLITATLDLSRLEAGRLPLELSKVHVPELIAEIEAETQELQRKPSVCVLWRVAPELPPLSTDAAKLKTVLKNVIANAVKFTDQGSVTVRVSARDCGVEFAVTDTGIGMAPDVLPIVFEPFRQVDGSPTRRHGGVGLGLYIVRRFLDLLGGTVAVESAVGQGSTFRVWVPLRTKPDGREVSSDQQRVA